MKLAAEPLYVRPYLETLNPGEVHGEQGDCANPLCPYQFTPADRKEMVQTGGWFTCPHCDMTWNYSTKPGSTIKVGITPTQLGDIGEDLIDEMHNVPDVGAVIWRHPEAQDPLDFIIGGYGVEVKTNHSEAQPRFKLGGQYERAQKIQKAMELGLTPALIGVRLNFYTNIADIFFRPQMSDTWIGQPGLDHIGQVNFSHLNPFKKPQDVPSVNNLPDDDES